MTETSVPVVIVGAGPVGMVLALELAHHGIASQVIEARSTTTNFPKMDETNARSMELLARLGVSEELREVGVPPEHSFDTVFCTSLVGRELARWPEPSVTQVREQIAAAVDGSTPAEPWQRVSQELAEDVLMRRCLAESRIQVRRPWRATAVSDHGDRVSVSVKHVETREEETISCEYLVGCDGARSLVRSSAGIGLEGTEDLLDLALVHFRSRDRTHLQAHGQYWHLYFSSGGILIAQDEDEVWTLHALVPAGTTDEDVNAVELIQQVTGAPVEVDEILARSVWRPNIVLADSYRSGRVFLAGDSCHQVIPNGGYGMNTGIGDAVDLGWKLSAVLSGWGGEALLDSYEAERRPQAARALEWSSRHVGAQLEILGEVDPDLVDETSEAADVHRAHLADFIAVRRGEASSPGIEYGYRYTDSPVLAQEQADLGEFDPTTYTPTTLPGARAPHVLLPDGTSILTAYSRSFTLVDHGGEGAHELIEAAARVGIPLQHLRLEPGAHSASVYERSLVLVRPDGHVAWRGDRVGLDPEKILAHAVGRAAVTAHAEEALR
ncbi:FAD-dependent monooxygenase [Nocardioides sp. NPDC127514]|uniref:FAD-dependent monooxygenase n=1 Tax=unclassified Nocardioides TaxID=2615069 RepID=UPI003333A351